MTFYHFTCDHGREAIGAEGFLRPACELTDRPVPETGRFVWVTDMAIPDRNALGLTSNFISCDRLAHRYRVAEYFESAIVPWTSIRRAGAPEVVADLESAEGARPRHWFVCRRAVPVTYDPIASERAS